MNCYNIIYIIYYYKNTVNLYRAELKINKHTNQPLKKSARKAFSRTAPAGNFLLLSALLYDTIKMLIFNNKIIIFFIILLSYLY